ncbi:MAG: hypothetical protein EZS28_054710, partial [Streblomastix strix]
SIESFSKSSSPSFSFVPYILASSKGIILQQTVNNAFIFPFHTALPIPPLGFCHFIHKLVLGGGKDILTVEDGQIQAQHYEIKCVNDIIIIDPNKNKIKTDKHNLKKNEKKTIKHTTAVVTTSSGSPILMQLDTGLIKEVDDDDFALPTGIIQNVIKIPPKWQNSNQIQEDRMAFGIAHGITGNG